MRLKKGEDRRLSTGHLWIFSNEVDVSLTPLKDFSAGEIVKIESATGRKVGFGYVNPQSLIAARLCSYKQLPDSNWLRERLNEALSFRINLYRQPYYRLVHGEGDFVPGLVVDRYGDTLVVQITTAGIELLKDSLVEILSDLLSPKVIFLKNDCPVRELEGLPLYRETVLGTLDDNLDIKENGFDYSVSAESAQKTGWFFDHRDNRARVALLTRGKSVLDCYCYAGGWGINALGAGAQSVVAIDSSLPAINWAISNAEKNGFSNSYNTIQSDVVESMREMGAAGTRFDVVILDPPAFIKRKKDYKQGLKYYELNNKLAIALLSPGGLLVSASCSQALSATDLSGTLLRAAKWQSRDLRLIGDLGQASDHPVNAAMSETRYLKGFIASIS